jgi:hypothetical protein
MVVILRGEANYVPFSDFSRLAPLSVGAELTSTWSVAWIKTSVALLLMRLRPTTGWRWFFYIMLSIQFVTATFASIMHLTLCIPIEALWTPTNINKRCWGNAAFHASLTVTSIIVILTDMMFALLPLSFLHHIRVSHRDRVVIGLLMALGLFASAASVVKTVYVHQFDEGGDFPGKGLSICLWGSIEVQVGIIAACIPCLRAGFLRFLNRIGVHTSSRPVSHLRLDTSVTVQHHPRD